jgi:aspartate aminotransferase-like enzyme
MTPTTPPLSLLYALDAALTMICEEGVEAVWSRHAMLGQRTREAVKRLGFALLADEADASNTVTALHVPAGFTAQQINRHLLEHHRVLLQGGQGKMTESVIRIGHMGWVSESDITGVEAAMTATVQELGLPLDANLDAAATKRP